MDSEFVRLENFFDAERGHGGEPCNWSTSDLRAWLDDPKWSKEPRNKLVKEVTSRLDELYSTFKPKYNNVTKNVDVSALIPWVPLKSTAPSPLPVRIAGPLERCFNASFRLDEQMQAMTMAELPMGRHPLDDFRQNLLILTKAIDDGRMNAVLLQDVEQTEAVTVRPLCSYFLPPGRMLKIGEKVVCHNLELLDDDVFKWSGLTATVTGKHKSTGTFTVAADAASGKGQGAAGNVESVTLPAWTLLPVKATAEASGVANKGSAVVMCGLKVRPELNGRFGVVEGIVNGGDAEKKRLSVRLLKTQKSVEVSVGVRPACAVVVEQPPVALLIAFNTSNRHTTERDVNYFASTQLQELMPLQNIRCTEREVHFCKRCIKSNESFLAPVPPSLKAKLLAPLNPRFWTLSLLMPPQPMESKAAQAEKEIKKAIACRQCSKPGTKECPLKSCSRCGGVVYCSPACQKADWKARHKAECTVSAGGSKGSTPGGGAASSPTGAGGGGGESVLVPISAVSPSGLQHVLTVNTGTIHKEGDLPTNLYGDQEFLVKVQNGFDPSAIDDPNDDAKYMGPLLVYDKARVLRFQVYKEYSADAHQRLMLRLRRDGIQGSLNPVGRKLFMRAVRQGPMLRLFLDRLPPQQHSW